MLDYVDSVLDSESSGYCLTDVYFYAREDGEDGNTACEVEINRVLNPVAPVPTAPVPAVYFPMFMSWNEFHDNERKYLLYASRGQDDGSF